MTLEWNCSPLGYDRVSRLLELLGEIEQPNHFAIDLRSAPDARAKPIFNSPIS